MSERIKLTGYLVPMEMVAERIAHLENENRRLTAQIKKLSTPDFYWDDQGEDFQDGEYHNMYDGHVEVVSCGTSLGLRYAVYIPTDIDPETGVFENGHVEYFDTKFDAELARDDAVDDIKEANP